MIMSLSEDTKMMLVVIFLNSDVVQMVLTSNLPTMTIVDSKEPVKKLNMDVA